MSPARGEGAGALRVGLPGHGGGGLWRPGLGEAVSRLPCEILALEASGTGLTYWDQLVGNSGTWKGIRKGKPFLGWESR